MTFATAFADALAAPSASPPSRSSVASNSPVEAPEGTAARPSAPESSATSTSTVGLPRESRIWRAWMCSIAPIAAREASGDGVAREPVRARRAAPSSGSTPEARATRRTASSSISPTAASVSSRVARSAGGAALGIGAAEDLARVEQPGQVLGDVGERVVGPAALDLALDPVPVARARCRRFGSRLEQLSASLAEDVRVAADQLRGDLVGDLGQRARAALLEQQREEDDLEEDVAELVAQLRRRRRAAAASASS